MEDTVAGHVNSCSAIDGKWLDLTPIRVGRVPAAQGTPHRYVCAESGRNVLRVDVYADPSNEMLLYEEAILWRDLVLIGSGHAVHSIGLDSGHIATINLDAYFISFYQQAEYVLVSSGDRVHSIGAEGLLIWRSAELGNDGVVVEDVRGGTIRGRGEWDPPGGWKSFAISEADGSGCQPESVSNE